MKVKLPISYSLFLFAVAVVSTCVFTLICPQPADATGMWYLKEPADLEFGDDTCTVNFRLVDVNGPIDMQVLDHNGDPVPADVDSWRESRGHSLCGKIHYCTPKSWKVGDGIQIKFSGPGGNPVTIWVFPTKRCSCDCFTSIQSGRTYIVPVESPEPEVAK